MTHVSITACYALQKMVSQFLQTKEIKEANKELYACLWELKSRPHDAVLNSLPNMPRSPHELIQALKDNDPSAGAPFGRSPEEEQDKPMFLKHSFYFVRMLASLELPNYLPLADLPTLFEEAELIKQITHHRSNAADVSTAQPALITAGDIKEVLQAFTSDPFSSYAKKKVALVCVEGAKTKQTRSRIFAADHRNHSRRILARLTWPFARWLRAVEAYIGRAGSIPSHPQRLEEKEPGNEVLPGTGNTCDWLYR